MKLKNYKPYTWLYLCLFFLSIAIIAISFLIPENSRWLSIVAGFGCSGIASVAVAWLIELANCYHKEKTNSEFLDNFFERYDIEIKHVLVLLLEGYAKREFSVDIDQDYTIHELYELINKADRQLRIWDSYYRKTGEAFSKINAAPLLYDPTPQHNSLHSFIRMAAENYFAYKDMPEKVDKESICFFAHIFLCGDLSCIESVYSLRNKELSISIKEESKDYIRNYRKSVALNKKRVETVENKVVIES